MGQRNSKVAVVLTGGGARAAYQAGALKAVCQICESQNIERPFSILTGSSAGAINAAFLAANMHQLPRAVNRLSEMWEHLRTDQIFEVGVTSVTRIGFRILLELITGRFSMKKRSHALLDKAIS